MTVDGAPVTLGTPKLRAVLAMLVMNRNRPVSIDSLITAAWEEARLQSQGQPALLHLQSAQVLGERGRRPEVGVGQRAAGIPAQRRRHRLRHRPIRGREGCRRARRRGRPLRGGQQAPAPTRWPNGADPCSTTCATFQFVDVFATALTEDKVVAHTARAEAEIACGRAYAVIGELESLTAEYPYREPLWAQLITAYYASERQSEALDAYQRLKSTLADDLGIDPGRRCARCTRRSCGRSRWT